jgi:glycerol-3-phosphate dehydrogenase (NAD(P)+)
VIASSDAEVACTLQRALSTTRFRVYASSDVRGVQLCGAAKNVIGIAAGISDGMGFGDNARAALITRGLAEMTRLGAALGADPRTYAGLAGLGDLVATCTSRHSRNRAAGELLARGSAPDAAEREVGMVAEGLHTAPALAALAREAGVDLPITDAVCSVIAGASIPEALSTLLARAAPAGEF